MKKLIILILVIAIIAGVGVFIYLTPKDNPPINKPTNTNLPNNPSEEPITTIDPSIPTVTISFFTPAKTVAPSYVAVGPETTPPSPNTETPSPSTITEKDFADDSYIFLYKGIPVCKLVNGQWMFEDSYLPSDILGVSQYYTYDYKGIKNITNEINALCSKRYRKIVGTFAEGFEKYASSYSADTSLATFRLPVSVPKELDTIANYIEKPITFNDNSYFATNASYNIGFSKVTANQYDPLKLTNITNSKYNRSAISTPEDVRQYLANYIVDNYASLDIHYEITYICEEDFDHDGAKEILYVISSFRGEKEIDYEYIEEYGHINVMLLKDTDGIYVIDGQCVGAQRTKEEIIQSGVYSDTFYDPCVVDLNDDGIYEIITNKSFDGGNVVCAYIYNDGKYIKTK